ncbi:MAG: universal stress protein, partial [Flexistipes sinusarabici]
MEFIKKILFPTDFSSTSEYAMKYALEFAKRFDAELEILHVLFDESQVVAFYLPQVTFQNL